MEQINLESKSQKVADLRYDSTNERRGKQEPRVK